MNIENYIKASNKWLETNRKNYKKIDFTRITKRLKRGNLLSIEADAKTTKGSKNGYLTGILYLAPHKIVGFNLCPFAVTCQKDCLFNAGRGRFASVTEARIIKTLAFLYNRKKFIQLLINDIKRLETKAKRLNMKPVVRLNGTSDLIIEKVFSNVLKAFPDVQFYDYTKNPNRKNLPKNYHLTFSFDGQNHEAAKKALNIGLNVAAVFENVPSEFLGHKVINGDESDLRFLDPKKVVVGLTAKGPAKNSESIFINKGA